MMLISEFKDYHVGQRCFVLGSGPSIANQNLSLLRNEVTFCSNWFFNHASFDCLDINYYCAYDDDFFHDSDNSMWLDKLSLLDITKFFPQHWRPHDLMLDKICYVPYKRDKKIYESNNFSADTMEGFYDGATVIINFCLPLAIHMGFSEIILLGCDCDYGIGKNGNMHGAYFYDVEDHHSPYGHTPKSEIEWQEKIFISYRAAKAYAISNGIHIYNATPGGNLEVFDRIDYETLFAADVV